MMKTIYVNQQRCVNCHACEVACKVEFNLPVGLKHIRTRLMTIAKEKGRWMDQSRPVYCRHCKGNPCVEVCPVKAISRSPSEDAVEVLQEKCIGCKLCLVSCPLSIPDFDDKQQMTKCGLCKHRLDLGVEPVCVQACPVGALALMDTRDLSAKLRKQILRQRVQ